MAKKLTHKASPVIIDLIQRRHPGVGRNISWDEAWALLGEDFDLEFDIKCALTTEVCIYKSGLMVAQISYNDVFSKEENIIDFDKIYRRVIEYSVKNKFIVLPKDMKMDYKESVKKAGESKKISKKEQPIDEEEVVEVVGNAFEEKYKDVPAEKMRNKKTALYMKIRKYKEAGKDITELSKELEYVKKLMKK